MTSSQNPDMENRSPQVEVEVNPPETSPDILNLDYHPSNWRTIFQDSYDRIVIWFDRIPSSGKVLVLAVGGLLGLTLLKTFLQLVSSLITLLVLGIIFYVVYKFWIAPNPNE
jgi:hypothetical protein